MLPLSSATLHSDQASGALPHPTAGRFQPMRNCCSPLCRLVQAIANFVYDCILRAGQCLGLVKVNNHLKDVKEISREVGKIILQIRDSGQLVSQDVELPNGKKVRQTNADIAASQYIIKEFAKRYPDHGILSQDQMDKDPLWHTKHAVWIVNPIDGTKEFEKGNDDFHIQIGLLVGNVPTFGMSYYPATDTYIYAAQGKGAWSEIDGVKQKLVAKPSSEKVLLKSSTHEIIQAHLSQAGWVPSKVIDESKSSTSRLLKLISGVASLYVSLGASPEGKEKKGGLWNFGANVVIAEEAGLTLRTLKGQPLNFREPNALLVDGVFITNDQATREAVTKADWILS